MSFRPESGAETPVASPGEPMHRLVRPGTIRGLRIGFGAVLAALALGDFFVHPHAGFGVDGTFGFYAWYGLGTCVAMVLFAKGLGIFLKRRDTWYDEGGETAPEGSGGGVHRQYREEGEIAASSALSGGHGAPGKEGRSDG